MKVTPTALPGVLVIEPRVFGDARGRFFELHHGMRYSELGVGPFVQDNVSVSRRGVLRGLHFQHPRSQGKLVTVLAGEVYDVAIDVRRGSPTYARWVGERLSEQNAHQFFVPAGFAHGFVVLSEQATFYYKCTDFYVPGAERTVLWNDPDIGIEWPVTEPLLSDRDARAPRLRDIASDYLPSYDSRS